MFKAIVDKPKFWMVKNNTVGTAHRGRDGQTKDFRPARLSVGFLYSQERIHAHIAPAKGVKKENLRELPGDIYQVDYGYPGPTTVFARFKLPDSGETFTATAQVIGHLAIPGFPQPADQIAAFQATLEENARRRAANHIEEPSEVASVMAFSNWLHAAVNDKQQRRVIARFARTGRNRDQMRQLLHDHFNRDPENFKHHHTIMRRLNWRELILAA